MAPLEVPMLSQGVVHYVHDVAEHVRGGVGQYAQDAACATGDAICSRRHRHPRHVGQIVPEPAVSRAVGQDYRQQGIE